MSSATPREQLLALAAGSAENAGAAEKYADHLAELFDAVDPAQIGEDYAHALTERRLADAAAHLAAYYRRKETLRTPGTSARGDYSREAVARIMGGTARVININWTFPEGKIDFLFDPTAIHGPRNNEWLWQFNRHSAWLTLARAYAAEGDERYAVEFCRQLLWWIAQTDIPENYNGAGSAWRTIECGIRLLGSWQVAFDGFRRSPSFGDVPLLLMIASMHRQSLHLMAHVGRENWRMGNWLMMEMNGVYTFSAYFPELKDADENRRAAANRLISEMQKQILPDGMQYELSPDYQSVVFGCAANLYELALTQSLSRAAETDPEVRRLLAKLGRPASPAAHGSPADHQSVLGGGALPLGELMRKLDIGAGDGADKLAELIHRTVHSVVLLSTPAFTQPRTNDCFTIHTEWFTSRTAKLLEDRNEYRFVNTRRAEGAPPAGETASAFLPYGGFAVMRSDWGPDAAYLCFDVGPTGMAHIHQDKLNVILYKGGEELIYDDGGGQYEQSAARRYGQSGYGHNTVLVDGLAQNRKGPAVSEAPIDAGWITNDVFDYAAAVYEDTFGPELTSPATHRREVRFCRPDFFVVADTLRTADGAAHDYELLFRMDTTKWQTIPGCENAVLSGFGRQYEVALIPADDAGPEVTLTAVSGVREGQMQGWYNGRNEQNLHPALTVSRTVRGVRDYRFVTLLFPLRAGEAAPRVTRDGSRLTVLFREKETVLDLDALNV